MWTELAAGLVTLTACALAVGVTWISLRTLREAMGLLAEVRTAEDKLSLAGYLDDPAAQYRRLKEDLLREGPASRQTIDALEREIGDLTPRGEAEEALGIDAGGRESLFSGVRGGGG